MGIQVDRPHLILGQNIAKRRISVGFEKAEDFAHKVGIGVSGLRDIERGVSEGRYDHRLAIANCLGCSLSDLYLDPKAPPKEHDFGSIVVFLSNFASAPHDIQKLVLAVLYHDETHLASTSRTFRQTAKVFLKAVLAL